MLKLVLFDGSTTYMFPNGEIATPAKIRAQFPAVDVFPHVLEINGHVCQAVQEFAAMRNFHGIDPALGDTDALAAMEAKVNAPAQDSEPSAEERIAAALEFQNLMSL